MPACNLVGRTKSMSGISRGRFRCRSLAWSVDRHLERSLRCSEPLLTMLFVFGTPLLSSELSIRCTHSSVGCRTCFLSNSRPPASLTFDVSCLIQHPCSAKHLNAAQRQHIFDAGHSANSSAVRGALPAESFFSFWVVHTSWQSFEIRPHLRSQEEGMTLVNRRRRCLKEGCSRQPLYGRDRDRVPLACGGHRLTGMVNVTHRRCNEVQLSCRLPRRFLSSLCACFSCFSRFSAFYL